MRHFAVFLSAWARYGVFRKMYDFGRIEDVDKEWVVPRTAVTMIERDVPEYLYKYTRRCFADDLVRRGSLRLGTLFGYRDGDIHTAGQHDPHEGTITFSGALPNGEKIAMPIFTRPKWMYCLTEIFNPKLLTSFHETYDTIVRIEAKPFFQLIAEALASEVNLSELRKVQYIEHRHLYLNPWPVDQFGRLILPCAAVIKSSLYKGQAEWRMTFEPNQVVRPVARNLFFYHNDSRLGVSAQFGVPRDYERFVPQQALQPKQPFVLPGLAQLCEIVR